MKKKYPGFQSIGDQSERKSIFIYCLILFAFLAVSSISYAQCDQPSQLTMTSLTTNSVSFKWTPPATGATGYDYYVTNDLINYPPINAETNSSFTGGTSATVSGLNASLTYRIYVRSRCNLLKSPWSTGPTFSPLEPNSGCANAPFGLNPTTTFTPSCTANPETIANDAYAGEYSTVNIIPNRQYVFNSSDSGDYVTITNSNLSGIVAHGQVPLVWNSTNSSGVFRYYLNSNGTCGTEEVERVKSITCQAVPSDCVPPISLKTSSISSNGVILSWSFSGSFTASQYYLSTNSTTPSINVTPTGSALTQDHATATGLNANTTYYYWVRSKCGTDFSNWVAGGSFSTLSSNPVGCIGSIYGQNPANTFTPGCFGNSEIIATNVYAGSYSNVNILPNKVYTFASSVSTDFITITDDDSFFVYASGTTPLVWSSAANTANIRFLLNTSSSCGSQSLIRAKSIICQDAAGSCVTPSSLVISSITSNTAVINWTAASPSPSNGYQYYYSLSNTVPSNAAVPSGSTATAGVTLSGLNPNSTYYFWVRSNCGTSQSNWVFGNSFSTVGGSGTGCSTAALGLFPEATFTPACFGIPEIIATNTYAGEYSNINIVANSQYTFTSSAISDYITITNADASVVYIAGNTPLVWSSGSNNGVIRYYLHANSACASQSTNRTRSITCQNTGPSCSGPSSVFANGITSSGAVLNWNAANPTPSNGYHYYYSTSSTVPTAATTVSGSTSNTGSAISGLNTNTVYYFWVRSNCGSTQSSWVSGGSFTTSSASSCNPPTALTSGNIGVASADISWTASASSPFIYNVYFSTSSTPPTAATIPVGDTAQTIVTLIDLTASTTYYFWVRSDCGTTQSIWTSGGSFTTNSVGSCTEAVYGQYPPATFTPACSGNAETIVTNAYASEYSNVNIVANKQYTFTSSVASDYITISNASGTVVYTSGNSPLTWLSGNNSGVIRYYFHIDPFCGSQNTERTRYITCTNAVPACNPPTGLTVGVISGSSALLNWTAPTPSPDMYDVYFSTSSVTPTAATIPVGETDATTATLINLTASTTYYFWVRSDCGAQQSVWVYGGSFTTNPPGNCTDAVYGLYPPAAFTPACSGNAETIVTNAYAGEYSNINVLSNKQYIFTSSVATDYVTITNAAGTSVYASGNSPLIWTSGAISGVVRYYFHVNSSCGSQDTDRVRFITCTNVAVACESPSAITITSTTSAAVSFTWNIPFTEPVNGYQYYYSTNSSNPTAATTPSGSTFLNSATVNGLNSSTIYYLWVRSNCSASQSVWVSGGSFFTDAPGDCTEAIYGVYPSMFFTPMCSGNAETIVVNAYAGEYSYVNIVANRQYTFASSVATDYITITNTAGTIVYASGNTPLVWSSGTTTETIRYYFHTNAACGSQNIERIRYITCSLPVPVCNSPTNIGIVYVTATSARVDYTNAIPSPSEGYDFYYSTVNISPETSPQGTTTSSRLLTGLSGSTTYYYWVRSDCDTLQSAWIFGGSFTTPPFYNCSGAIYGINSFTAFTPSCSGATELVSTNNWAGHFSEVNFVSNKQYTFTSSVSTDYLTITNATGSILYAGGVSPVVWNSGSNSGILRYFIHSDGSCGGQMISRSKFISCTTFLANETFESGEFNLFPNPTTDIVNFSYTSTIDKIEITNMLGQHILEKKINDAQGNIDLSRYAAGTYFIKVYSDDRSKVFKVIKQ